MSSEAWHERECRRKDLSGDSLPIAFCLAWLRQGDDLDLSATLAGIVSLALQLPDLLSTSLARARAGRRKADKGLEERFVSRFLFSPAGP